MKVILLLTPFIVAILLVIIALWARRKNSESRRDGRPLRQEDVDLYLMCHDYRKAAKVFFFGTLAEPMLTVGKSLAIVAIAGVLAFVLAILFNLY